VEVSEKRQMPWRPAQPQMRSRYHSNLNSCTNAKLPEKINSNQGGLKLRNISEMEADPPRVEPLQTSCRADPKSNLSIQYSHTAAMNQSTSEMPKVHESLRGNQNINVL